jgi:hypothetical protein
MMPRPDRLDCVLTWAISSYELGDARPLSGAELEELAQRWDHGFLLDDDERKALREHHPLDLDWVEMVVPGFWQLLCGEENSDWGSEALQHIAQMIARRVGAIDRYADFWGTGTTLATSPDGTPSPLVGILATGFPNPSSL